MNKIKFLLVFIMLLSAGLVYAQLRAVRFYDSSGTGQTKAALDPECILVTGSAYTTTNPPSAARWRWQWYKDGGDGVISPLDPVTHGPTGDDVICTGAVDPPNTNGVVGLSPTGAWTPSAITFNPPGSPGGNTTDGDRVFIRIFNNNQIAAATKSMTFTALYTITADALQNITPFVPAYAWGPWTPISVGPTTYNINVTSTPSAEIYIDGVSTGFFTPHTFTQDAGWDGLFTVVLPNYTWDPINYQVTDLAANTDINFDGIYVGTAPPAVDYVSPANGSTTGWVSQMLTWQLAVRDPATSFKVYFGDSATPPFVAEVPAGTYTWATPTLLPAQTYYWQIGAWNTYGETLGPVWSFTTRAEYDPNPATYISPTNGYVFNVLAANLPLDVTLDWEAGAVDGTHPAPTGYRLWVNGAGPTELPASPTEYVLNDLPVGIYNWQINPYYTDPGSRGITEGAPVSVRLSNAKGETTGDIWSFQIVETTIPTYSVLVNTDPEVNADIWINGADSGFDTPYTFNWEEGTDWTIAVQKEHYSFAPASVSIDDLAANQTVTFYSTYIPWIMYDVLVNTDPEVNADIWINGADSGFDTPHTFEWLEGTDWTIAVQKEHYSFAPASVSIDDLAANQTVTFYSTYIPWIIYEVTVQTNIEVNATIWLNGVETTFTTPETFEWLEGTDWTIAVQKEHYSFAPASVSIDNLAADQTVTFISSYIPYIMYDVLVNTDPEVNADIWINGADSGFDTPHTFEWLEGTDWTIDVAKEYYTFSPDNYTIDNLAANQTYTFTWTYEPPTGPVLIDPPNDAMDLVYGNAHLDWDYGTLPTGAYFQVFFGTDPVPGTIIYTGTQTFYNTGMLAPNTMYYWFVRLVLPTGGFMDSPIWHFTTGQTVPVELSSFTAAVTADMFVSLTWVTQSETGVLGYNVYRSENSTSPDLLVNGSIIQAFNTSTQQIYNFVDNQDLETGHVYYYWLENVDLDGYSELHGPISATINEPSTPPITEVSVLNSAYPNPFRVGQSTNIGVSIKEGETGTVTIYNLLGQTVKTYQVGPGSHTLTWNANGNASGIYFYKLSTPSTNVTKKLVIVN